MTVAEWPNHFRYNGNRDGSYAQFGAIYSLTPVCIPGEGHHPHIAVRFRGGVTVDLDPATAAELARRLPAVLAFLPIIPECSAIASDLEAM